MKGKGKLVDGGSWEDLVLYNFQALRCAGLARPLTREVEAALGITPVQADQPAATAAGRTGRR